MRRQCQITPSIRAHLEESCPFKTSLLFVIASFQLSLILHKCQIRLHKTVKNTLALFRVSIFGAAQGWAGEAKRSPLPKICLTYPTMMRPGTVVLNIKKIKKIYELRNTSLEFCCRQLFSPTISDLLYQEIQI